MVVAAGAFAAGRDVVHVMAGLLLGRVSWVVLWPVIWVWMRLLRRLERLGLGLIWEDDIVADIVLAGGRGYSLT